MMLVSLYRSGLYAESIKPAFHDSDIDTDTDSPDTPTSLCTYLLIAALPSSPAPY